MLQRILDAVEALQIRACDALMEQLLSSRFPPWIKKAGDPWPAIDPLNNPDAMSVVFGNNAPGADCNANNAPDSCDIASGGSEDCNGNAVPDECDIAGAVSQDVNRNGVPDECECPANRSCLPCGNLASPGERATSLPMAT